MQSAPESTNNQPEATTGAWRDARRLFRFVAAYRSKLILGFFAVQLSGLLQLAFPFAVGRMVEGTMLNLFGQTTSGAAHWYQSLPAIATLMMIIVILILLFSYWGLTLFAEIGERGLADLRAATYENLVKLPMAFFSNRRSGELSSRMLSDLGQIQELWIHDFRMLLRYATIAIGGIVLMFVTSAKLALVILTTVPFIVIAGFLIGKRIRTLSAHSQDELAKSAVVLQETLQAIQAVKAFNNEHHEIARYRTTLDNFLPPAIRSAKSRAFFVCAILFIIFTTFIFIMMYGSSGVENKWLTPGSFMTFMFYLAFASSAGGTLAELYGKMQRVLGANTRIVEILDHQTEQLDTPGETPSLLPIEGHVRFDNVHFAYPSRATITVLDGITLDVKAGERIALVGPSGAGKSTIVALLLRFFEPDSGQISIDGEPATTYPLGWLRSQMAFVPQEILLFGGSIRDNIAYGNTTASDEAIEKAAATAHALDFIQALPEGFNTEVGDRGFQLSGGQRQRIALARAILKNPAILILDEATSSLDTESEQLIQKALEQIMQERTSFIIAHRLSTVQKADRILVIRNGKIAESGDHKTLIAQNGIYTHLWQQSSGTTLLED
jgi:ATP-binding cassette subfamily B protein